MKNNILGFLIEKKTASAELQIPKPAVHRLRATLPWNYIRCRSRGSSVERFCNLQFGSRCFFYMKFLMYIFINSHFITSNILQMKHAETEFFFTSTGWKQPAEQNRGHSLHLTLTSEARYMVYHTASAAGCGHDYAGAGCFPLKVIKNNAWHIVFLGV